MNSSNRPDQELLDLLKTGDRFAFAAIYDRHGSSLFRVALNILSDSTGSGLEVSRKNDACGSHKI